MHSGNHRLSVALGQGSNFAAGAALVAPEFEQFVDFLECEPEGTRTFNETQFMNIAVIENGSRWRSFPLGSTTPQPRSSG